MGIKKSVDVSVEIDPEEVAQLIWEMDDSHQIIMLNSLAEITNYPKDSSLEYQMESVNRASNPGLTDNARKMIIMMTKMIKEGEV